MILGSIYKKESGELLVPKVWKVAGIFERMRGLIARQPLKKGEGFLLSPCSSVHTFGMKYALDLVFISKEGKISKLVHSLPPRRLAFSSGAFMTLELLSGSAKELGLKDFMRIDWMEGERCAQ